MKKVLGKAIEDLPGGSKKKSSKFKVDPIDAPASVVTPARIDGTYAEDLAGKITLAFLLYRNTPNSTVVTKDLQVIADLCRDLHRALHRPTGPVTPG